MTSADMTRAHDFETDMQWRARAACTLATKLPGLLLTRPRSAGDVGVWLFMALAWPALLGFIVAGPDAWGRFVDWWER